MAEDSVCHHPKRFCEVPSRLQYSAFEHSAVKHATFQILLNKIVLVISKAVSRVEVLSEMISVCIQVLPSALSMNFPTHKMRIAPLS